MLRVVRDPAQSEEVTQEVFLEIWRHCARFDPDRGSALSWMLTIAHRKAVDRVRSAEAPRRRDDGYGAEATRTSTTTPPPRPRRPRSMPSASARALDTLTEPSAARSSWPTSAGYTHTEVAALLDLPLGTAKTRIRDGLIRLRDTLGARA